MYIAIIILILAAIAAASVLIFWKATDQMFRYWEIVRYFKRRDVRPHMDSIRNINESIKVNNSAVQSKNTQKGCFNAFKHRAKKLMRKERAQ